jgi:hypothetical protein
VDQIGAVKIAAGFARADEQSHEGILPLEKKRERPIGPFRIAAEYQGSDDRGKPGALASPPSSFPRGA